MANDDQSRKVGREFQDDLDRVLSRANPNPDRVGCFSREVLEALAAREQSLDDPAYEHLLNCSECYREFRGIQDPQFGSGRES